MSRDRDKSWKEIDRQRDKSSHRDGSGGKSNGKDARTSSYKRALDKLFEPNSDVPDQFKEMMEDLEPEEGSAEFERKEAIKKLREAKGFKAFTEAVNLYRENGFALPDNENLLLRMLDHPDEHVIQDVLEHFLDLGNRRELKRINPLRNRLSTLEIMASEQKTHGLIEDVEELIDG